MTESPPDLFQQASLEDARGNEGSAIPLYQAALAEGLENEIAQRALIQLASSLRNVGRQSEALDLLSRHQFDARYEPSKDAFIALVHWDMGNTRDALQCALAAAGPALGEYRHAINSYAHDL